VSAHLTGFWTRAAALSLGLLALTALVLIRGDRGDLRPLRVTPADGATSVSVRPVIRLEYAHALDPEAARAAFRIEPPVDGTLNVVGRELAFTPARPLVPGTTYAVVVAAGARELTGRSSRADLRATFQTRAPRLVVLRGPRGGRGAWVVDPERGSGSRVSDPGDDVALVAPSPDGDEIAYLAPRGEDGWAIKAAGVDGRPTRLIAEGEGTVARLAWSPAGDLLAYSQTQIVGRRVMPSRIWVVRADGRETALVYGRGDETGEHPVWSPDGRQLAFYDHRYSAFAVYGFTGQPRMVRAEIGSAVSWAPDGAAIAFVDRVGQNGARMALKVARPGEGEADQITAGEAGLADQYPAWSPTGDWIAFTRLARDTTYGLWVSRPDGADARQLLGGERRPYTPPAWSPDGRAVALSHHAQPGDDRSPPEAWVVPLDGPPRPIAGGGTVVGWSS
jgi:Tol biopolymer transport system component